MALSHPLHKQNVRFAVKTEETTADHHNYLSKIDHQKAKTT